MAIQKIFIVTYLKKKKLQYRIKSPSTGLEFLMKYAHKQVI